MVKGKKALLFSPLVLATNLVLLLRSEVILDVECLANLLGGLALDHVGDSLAADVQKSLDIKVVGSLRWSQLSSKPVSYHPQRTRMISKSISWSTCMNFWSHSSISVVLRRESSSSPVLGGSFLWWVHHSMTFFRTDSLTYWICLNIFLLDGCMCDRLPTLGIGIASPESPKSSSMFLIRIDRSATSRSVRIEVSL